MPDAPQEDDMHQPTTIPAPPTAHPPGGADDSPGAAGAAHYRRPGWLTRNVMNRLVGASTRAGLSLFGSEVLEHRGRRTGVAHHTPVNPLSLGGERYLVAPRGEAEWVRNVRADGGRLVLIRGRRRRRYTGVEVAPSERRDVLRAYLARWKFEVGAFFDGVGPDSTDEQLDAIAPRHPVLRLRAEA